MTAVCFDEPLRAALSGDRTPKFLATLDADARPNCVPIITLMPLTGDTLIFGEFFMNKSRRNLLLNDKVGVAVLNDALDGWSLKGTFLGFETAGERVEFINRLPLFRYNAYTAVRSVGTVRIQEVSERRSLTRARFLLDFARAKAVSVLLRSRNNAGRCMPLRVEEKFRRMTAVRAVAFRDQDGYPRAFPVMSCVPAGPNRLAFCDALCSEYVREIPLGADMAVAIITREPIAYQVKGRCVGTRAGVGVIDLTECYSASPPLLGERLDR